MVKREWETEREGEREKEIDSAKRGGGIERKKRERQELFWLR